jgi:hypothetical protein
MKMVDFQWWRCRDGYRLEQNGELLVAASERFDRYHPMEIGGLFAIFAREESTPEGMQSFCNRYGLLGEGRADIAPLFTASLVGPVIKVGIDDFLWHHQAMRGAVDLFNSGDVSKLAEIWNASHGFPVIRTELRVKDDGGLEMVLAPPSLINALWFQFAQFACSGSQLLRCERCSTPFVVGSKTGRRSSSKWCSNACKVAAYQERQKETAQ